MLRKKVGLLEKRIDELEIVIEEQEQRMDTLGVLMVDLLKKFQNISEETMKVSELTQEILDKINASVD